MKSSRFWWLGVLLLAAALAYPLREEMHTYVFVPILLALRLERLLVQSVPQGVWWLVLIFMVIGLGVRSVKIIRQPGSKGKNQPQAVSSSVDVWRKALKGAAHSRYSRWLVAQRLSALTVEWIAHQQRLSPDQARRLVLNGEINLPEHFQAYVQAGLEAPALPARPSFWGLFMRQPEARWLSVDAKDYIAFLEEKINSGGGW